MLNCMKYFRNALN